MTKAGPVAKPAAEVTFSVDSSGRKWIAPGIPYDVFPDLPDEAAIAAAAAATTPETVASDSASETSVASIERASSRSTPAEPASPTPQASSEGSSWQAILPREQLLNEVATLRNEMGEGLLTVGNYNDAFEQISNDGWVMSALATIVAETSEEISWKPNALLARDIAVKLAGAASGRGRQNFSEAQAAQEQLFAILNNNVPPGLPEPDLTASREETADRAALMKRMQSAFERLKSLSGNDGEFAKNASAAAQDARLLAALAKFTSHKDYGGTANADYQEFAKVLVDGGLEMAKAASAQDAATFTAKLDGVGTACNNCHQKYRFNSN